MVANAAKYVDINDFAQEYCDVRNYEINRFSTASIKQSITGSRFLYAY